MIELVNICSLRVYCFKYVDQIYTYEKKNRTRTNLVLIFGVVLCMVWFECLSSYQLTIIFFNVLPLFYSWTIDIF